MPTTILDNETYPEALQRRYAEETKAEKQAEIIRMAEKACAPHQILNTDLVFLERFFNLAFAAGAAHEREKHSSPSWETVDDAIAAEREACAKVCDAYADKCVEAENWEAEDVSLHCAAAIRARGEK